MPFANVKVIEGVFSPEEKQRIITEVTEALVAVEGEGIRDKTLVIVEETKSGDWGIGGHSVHTDEIRHLRRVATAGAQS